MWQFTNLAWTPLCVLLKFQNSDDWPQLVVTQLISEALRSRGFKGCFDFAQLNCASPTDSSFAVDCSNPASVHIFHNWNFPRIQPMDLKWATDSITRSVTSFTLSLTVYIKSCIVLLSSILATHFVSFLGLCPQSDLGPGPSSAAQPLTLAWIRLYHAPHYLHFEVLRPSADPHSLLWHALLP